MNTYNKMTLKSTLRKVVKLQEKDLKEIDLGLKRELLPKIKLNLPHAIILSGVRRCGKSTLLKQIIKTVNNSHFINFEDQRLINFTINDFEKLDEIFKEDFEESDYYFFDEIQNVAGWERYVRGRLDSRKKFIITGSNASLLSKELGSKLTGRHLTYELFPFSYTEMLRFKSKKPSLSSFQEYFNEGGFPEYLKYKKIEILQELLNDILMRDIVIRYKLRESKTIKELAIYLITNLGKEFSYNNLKNHFNLGSTNSVISYISYFEDSYLLFTIQKFDYSYKKQILNKKKVYSIDVGLSNANSASFSEDKGRILENIVFLHLRRKFKEVYYFKEKYECDFIIREKGKMTKAVQVCYELNEENKDRELFGLKEAMKKLNIKDGAIITFNQEDKIDGIKMIPAWKWLLR